MSLHKLLTNVLLSQAFFTPDTTVGALGIGILLLIAIDGLFSYFSSVQINHIGRSHRTRFILSGCCSWCLQCNNFPPS